jgi:hypothetical protein
LDGIGVLLGMGVSVAGPGVFVNVAGVRFGVSVGKGVFGVFEGWGVLVAGGVVLTTVGTGVADAFTEGCCGDEKTFRSFVFPVVDA